MNTGILSSAILLSAVSVSAVAAEDTTTWGTVSGWSIIVDKTMGNGCFAMTSWEGGSVVRIGIDPRPPLSSYVIVGNKKWTSLEVGKKYRLEIKFDDNVSWDVPTKAIALDPLVALYADLDSDFKFFDEFSASSIMNINFGSKNVDKLKLTGSAQASAAVVRCQNQQKLNDRKKSDDPFVSISDESDDPFVK